MTTVDELSYLAEEARRASERLYHDMRERHGEVMEPELVRRVSRPHFRRAVDRGSESGSPYGVHTIVYRELGDLLLVRHEPVDMWVLPGGEVGAEESFREAAARELREEAGVEAEYDGLAMLLDVTIHCGDYETAGYVPVYAAEATTDEPEVSDPDGEITDAQWFDELPEDTRDRWAIEEWRERKL
ncbi:NUDIX hydrolase [Halobacteriales archaeon QS_1_68_20]|nr:MAG: NUDIX hydrolase [Halobacteriales archaeon QS_1_68_20]